MRDKQSYRIRRFSGYWRVLLFTFCAIFGMCVVGWAISSACEWLNVIIIVLLASALVAVIVWVSTQPRYRIKEDTVQHSLFGIPYRTIRLSKYPKLVITNAVYHVKGSGYLAGEMPIIDKTKPKENGHAVCYPYFMALTQDYPIEKIHSGMNASEIYSVNWDHATPIGLCYAEALEYFRDNTGVELYVQADVLAHYPELFTFGGKLLEDIVLLGGSPSQPETF